MVREVNLAKLGMGEVCIIICNLASNEVAFLDSLPSPRLQEIRCLWPDGTVGRCQTCLYHECLLIHDMGSVGKGTTGVNDLQCARWFPPVTRL